MGTCLSKKTSSANASSPTPLPKEPQKPKSDSDSDINKVAEDTNVVKKEVFIIKHRTSHERSITKSEEERPDPKKAQEKDIEIVKAPSPNDGSANPNFNGLLATPSAPVRTSSCTKEEVDAILIQCGRLSRSSSTGKVNMSPSDGGGLRKYSGSKRSYDFDSENVTNGDGREDDGVAKERENRRRDRSRSHSRRRTPSRERDSGSSGNHQQRSGKSRERGNNTTNGGTTRRVSRSPGRRSESPVTTSNGAATLTVPGKMVSVPATDKSGNNIGGEGNNNAVKRIQVKRNVGGNNDSRNGTSPRARSPARVRVLGEKNQNAGSGQVPNTTLSRSNSRKAEQSPCRRNALGEIDTNIIASQAPTQKPYAEYKSVQGAEYKINSSNPEPAIPNHIGLNVISSGNEIHKPNTVTRSRSTRLSRDFDAMNPETATNNPNTSYTALLLEDIQNFHQKNNTPSNFSLPACVTKACSILEAVADLNSSTGSNLPEDRRRKPITELQMSSNKNSEKPSMMTRTDPREPFIESEVVAKDDLMEPSFQKYVTMKRGTMMNGEDLEEIESSGSNSYAGSQQQWLSSSSWEPNSAESTDHWMMTSSRSISPVGFQRSSALELGKNVDESGKRLAVKKWDSGENQRNGIGRGRIGSRGSS